MKRHRQQKILEIINAKRISTQEDLADELARHGFEATQSSISRDINQLKLAKANGYYTLSESQEPPAEPVLDIDTAGENLLVIKTEIGLASPTALRIDRAKIEEIVGTVAGDDTILVAVKNGAAQKMAIKKINKLFGGSRPRSARSRRLTGRSVWT